MSGSGIYKKDTRTDVCAIGCPQNLLSSTDSSSNVGELGHCNFVWHDRCQAERRFETYSVVILAWRADQRTFGDDTKCSLSTNEQFCSIETDR